MTTQARAGRGKPGRGRTAARTLEPIRRLDDVPNSMTGEAAADFYGAHAFTAEALAEMPDVSHEFVGGVARTRPISIRLSERMLAELKALAADKGVAYQALIKVWLDERLREERDRAKRPA